MASRPLIVLALALVLSVPLSAQEKEKRKPKKELTREEIAQLGGFEPAPDAEDNDNGDISLDMLVVDVPDDAAVPLIENFKDPSKAESSYRKVIELISSKKAKLVSWPTIITRNGNRAVAENIMEVRYAIEFDPGRPAADPAQEEPKENADRAAAAAPPGPQAPAVIGVLPTTFETRNAGVSLEIEPVIVPGGKLINAQFAASHVQLLGWDPTTVTQNERVTARLPQPRFHTNKVSENATLTAGVPMLVGSFRAANPPDHMELFILRASLKKAKAR
jgi:hypothetical protein